MTTRICYPILFSAMTAGCAFDVVKIERQPATLRTDVRVEDGFTLRTPATIDLSTGYSRTLKAPSIWRTVGSLPQGHVLTTDGQTLTVEGSNIYEAYIVVSGRRLMGFYLPANRNYSPLQTPIELDFLTTGGRSALARGGN